MTVYACCDHCSMRGPHEAHATPCSALCSKGGERAQGLREGAASETDGVSGGELHQGDFEGTVSLLRTLLRSARATIEDLRQTCDRIRRHSDLLSADLAERDATIDRLWAQLNEATNVPDAPTAPTCEGKP